MQHPDDESFPINRSIPVALSIGGVCHRLSQVAHDAGLYRMSFLLAEIVQEAELALEVHQHQRAFPAVASH